MLSPKVLLSPVITWEMTRVLGALCRELGTKNKYMFLFVSQCPTLTDRSVIANWPWRSRMTGLPGCPQPPCGHHSLCCLPVSPLPPPPPVLPGPLLSFQLNTLYPWIPLCSPPLAFLFPFFVASPHNLWDLSSLTDQGLNPRPQQWQLGVLTTGPPGNSTLLLFTEAIFKLHSVVSWPSLGGTTYSVQHLEMELCKKTMCYLQTSNFTSRNLS